MYSTLIAALTAINLRPYYRNITDLVERWIDQASRLLSCSYWGLSRRRRDGAAAGSHALVRWSTRRVGRTTEPERSSEWHGGSHASLALSSHSI